jgi:hypothetical protein
LPWLLGTARKVLGHRHRAERRRAAHLTVSSLEGVEVADPEIPVPERLARRESLAAAFAALPERDREILTLVAWEGLAPREGAQVLGCSAATFSLRLHRARRRLSKELAASFAGDLRHSEALHPPRLRRPDSDQDPHAGFREPRPRKGRGGFSRLSCKRRRSGALVQRLGGEV